MLHNGWFRKIGVAALLACFALTASPGDADAQKRRGKKDKDKDKEEQAKVDDSTAQKVLSVRVGESQTIVASDVKQYSEGPGGIADIKVTPDGKRFVVSGRKQGTTSLLLIKNDGSQVNYSIKVFSQDPTIVEGELAQLLQPYMGVRVRQIGTRLFIEGGVSTKDDEKRIQQIAELYTGQVESLVTVGTGAVDRRLNIRIDVFFVQYNKGSGWQFGVSWPDRIGGVQDPAVIQSTVGYDFVSRTTTANVAVVNHPLPGLDIAANNGWAKVLKQATIVTTNGTEAEFKNGGEEYFLIASGNDATLEKIVFGTNLLVQPRFDPRTQNLEMKVTTEISDLVPPRSGATQLPGLQTAGVSTVVFMRLGESLVLSGIKSRSRRHSINGIPLLSQIPVLGVFFGTHSNQEEEIEGALFIIPSIVESVTKSSYDMVEAAMAQYEEYSGDYDDVDAYKKPPPDYEKDTKSGGPRKLP
jgi:pilus assembly protein CpaC